MRWFSNVWHRLQLLYSQAHLTLLQNQCLLLPESLPTSSRAHSVMADHQYRDSKLKGFCYNRGDAKKRDVRINNINAAKAVADAVRTSLGPRGMDKMVSCINHLTLTALNANKAV